MPSAPTTPNGLRERALAAWADQHTRNQQEEVAEVDRLTEKALAYIEKTLGHRPAPTSVTDATLDGITLHVDGLDLEYDDNYGEGPEKLGLYVACKERKCTEPAYAGEITNLAELGRILSRSYQPACHNHAPQRLRPQDTPEARLAQAIRDLVDQRLAQREE